MFDSDDDSDSPASLWSHSEGDEERENCDDLTHSDYLYGEAFDLNHDGHIESNEEAYYFDYLDNLMNPHEESYDEDDDEDENRYNYATNEDEDVESADDSSHFSGLGGVFGVSGSSSGGHGYASYYRAHSSYGSSKSQPVKKEAEEKPHKAVLGEYYKLFHVDESDDYSAFRNYCK